MNRLIDWLFGSIIVATLVCEIAPSLVKLMNAFIPAVLVVGLLAVLGRVVWFYTRGRF